ncbi:hypothetical protein J6590_011122 [Homalodisca vitripennis]|nr:hypothetical protein J6590_011122 [Homalodisca vitripennis]
MKPKSEGGVSVTSGRGPLSDVAVFDCTNGSIKHSAQLRCLTALMVQLSIQFNSSELTCNFVTGGFRWWLITKTIYKADFLFRAMSEALWSNNNTMFAVNLVQRLTAMLSG